MSLFATNIGDPKTFNYPDTIKRRTRIEIPCMECGKMHERRASQYNNSKIHCCSHACYSAHERGVAYHPDKVIFRYHHEAKKRAAKKTPTRPNGREFTITKEFVKELYEKQNGLCALTGWKLTVAPTQRQVGCLRNPFELSIDRIDSSKGYTPDNVQLTGQWVNKLKSAGDNDHGLMMCDIIGALSLKRYVDLHGKEGYDELIENLDKKLDDFEKKIIRECWKGW